MKNLAKSISFKIRKLYRAFAIEYFSNYAGNYNVYNVGFSRDLAALRYLNEKNIRVAIFVDDVQALYDVTGPLSKDRIACGLRSVMYYMSGEQFRITLTLVYQGKAMTYSVCTYNILDGEEMLEHSAYLIEIYLKDIYCDL